MYRHLRRRMLKNYKTLTRELSIRHRENLFYQKQRGVTVPLRHGIGNKLLQYCFGRILADRTQLRMDLDYRVSVHESGIHQPFEQFLSMFGIPRTIDGDSINGIPRILQSNSVNPAHNDGSRPLVVYGQFFLYEHLREYKALIQNNWLTLDMCKLPDVPDNAACVHIRLGDIAAREQHLNVLYYRRAVEIMEADALHIVTDQPQHPIIKDIAHRFSARISSSVDWIDDFRLIAAHKRIAISESSFSWWAAWLSNAELIVSPGPNMNLNLYGGYWANRLDKMNPYVDDESRYTYIN